MQTEAIELNTETIPVSTVNTDTQHLNDLMTEPNTLFTQFCEDHQRTNPRVSLSTLQKNNMMHANFLQYYYSTIISKYTNHRDVQDDEDFTALLAFYVNHMENVHNPDPFHINIGKGMTTTVRDARTASFQYCMQLLPQIQKKLLGVET